MDNQNYVICSNCRQYVPSGSAFCNNCGARFIYQNNPQYYNPMYQQVPIQQPQKRSDSVLSAIAGIVSLMGILSYGIFIIIGFIIGLIDISIGQATKDNHYHFCSWFSIIVFIIFIILVLSGFFN